MAITTTAPYTSGQAVLTVIQRYRDKGLTLPITGDVLLRAGVSDSLIPRTLPALQQLDLIDDSGMPTDTFKKMRTVPQDQYQSCLADWLRAVYADVFQFVDPQTDDATRIRDAFRTYAPHGQQDRMVTLFMALCVEAGLMPEIKKPEAKSAPRKAAATRTVQRQAKPANPPPPPLPRSGLEAFSFPPALLGMLQSIPSADKGWNQQDRDRFIGAFSAVLDYSIPIRPDREPESEPTFNDGFDDER